MTTATITPKTFRVNVNALITIQATCAKLLKHELMPNDRKRLLMVTNDSESIHGDPDHGKTVTRDYILRDYNAALNTLAMVANKLPYHIAERVKNFIHRYKSFLYED